MIKLKKLDKKTEKVFKESDVMVLLENMNDNIKLLAEGQSASNEKLDSLESRFDGLENRFDTLEMETKAGFKMVLDYLKRIDEEIIEIKTELEDTKEKKVDWVVYSLLEKRVEMAEEQIKEVKILLKAKKIQS